jgi:hypothetical protein
MRTLIIASLTALALGACSSTPAGGSGSSTGAGTATTTGGTTTGVSTTTTITFTNVDVHPAAKAALMAAGFPVPSITSGAYQLVIHGVSVTLSAAGATIVLTDAGYTPITSTGGPYVFTLPDEFLLDSAPLGVLAGVVPLASSDLGDGGLPQPSCTQFGTLSAAVGAYWDAGAGAVVPDFLLDAGFVDYLIPTGLEVGGLAQAPIADVPDAVVYAIPMSYAVMLNCAGNPTKTTRDTDIGEAVVYITNGTGPGQGMPVAGAVTPLKNAAGTPTATYYADGYTMTDTTGTDSTGIATFLGVSPASTTPPTITVQGVPGFTALYGISTQPNAFFSIVAYPH